MKTDQTSDSENKPSAADPSISGYVAPVRDSGLEGSWTPAFDNGVDPLKRGRDSRDSIVKK